MNKRNKIIVSIVGITIVLLALLGITYAYYLTRIEGNTNTNSISITTANLKLTYGDGNTEILTSDTLLMPGEFEGTKDFTVINNGNASVTYGVILEDMINPLSRPQDMKMILSCSSDKEDSGCSGLDEMNLPSTNEFLVENTIEVGETHTYELKLRYIEAGEDQSIDMGKTISGKVNIIDSHDTVDMTGVVANYEEGDYVQVNSEPKISYITKDGKYKVVGLKPEQHTIAVYKKDGTLKGARELTIKTGTSESISENKITITKDTRTIRMNVTAINQDNTITTGSASLDKYNPFKSGTLAYEILNNANNVTEEEKTLGYAEYIDKPLSNIASETNKFVFGDLGPSLEIKEYTFDQYYEATTTNYFTYADSYEIVKQCYEYEDDPCYYYDEYYTLKNSDGTSVRTVQGYSGLVGKYIVDYSGSTSSTIPDVSELYSIYYVTRVEVDRIYYIEFCCGNNSFYGYTNYFTYSDSYEFNEKTGTYTLMNSDGSSVESVIFEDNIEILEGKYITNLYGSTSSNVGKHTGLSSIYKIAQIDSKLSFKYNSLSNYDVSVENILTKTFDDYGESFYYRGDVSNNYLNFGGMCWRIVRIEGDNSIKLLLDDQYNECNSDSYTGNWKIGSGSFGTNFTGDIYNINFFATTSFSSANKNFQLSLLNKLSNSSLENYLRPGKWCYDSSAYADVHGTTEIDDVDSYFAGSAYSASYVRLENFESPTLKCRSLNNSITTIDSFLDGTDMYVGGLTASEVVFAGLHSAWTSSANTFDAIYFHNDYSKEGGAWATITPFSYSNNTHWGSCFDRVYVVSYDQKSVDYIPVKYDNSYRPSIVLKNDIGYISGDGSKSNPYVVG